MSHQANSDLSQISTDAIHHPMPQGLLDCLQTSAGLCGERRISVGSLQVVLKASDPGLVSWLTFYLQPLLASADSSECDHHYEVTCRYDDELVSSVGQWAKEDARATAQGGFEGYQMSRHRLSDAEVVYVDRRAGVIHLVDTSRAAISTVVSTRTRWPALEYARVVRELATRFLESNGYCQYHAGCIGEGGSFALIVGDKGSGKTTLTLLAMSLGATYLANDRVFVRDGEDAIHALPFPLSVAVGMGTLLQFPSLAKVLDEPLLSRYPRMRWDIDKTQSLPREALPTQPDKVEFVPDELSRLLHAPNPAARGHIVAVISPRVSHLPIKPLCTPIDREKMEDLLKRNQFRLSTNRTYPAWTDLGFPVSPVDIESLLQLPAYELAFHVSAGDAEGNAAAYKLVRRVLECE